MPPRSRTLTLAAADGHHLQAYEARPAGPAKAGLVVLQEIFGVNRHMRSVADGFAAEGYVAIAPALFDRIRPGIELGYGEDDIQQGRDLRAKITWAQVFADVRASIAALAGVGPLGIVGYCWGGSLAWRAATQIDGVAAAVCYYGGQIAEFAAERPRSPVLMHFGETDHAIPLSDVDRVRAAQKDAVTIHLYPAGHGFNCDERGSFDAACAKLARGRTLEFFARHLKPKT